MQRQDQLEIAFRKHPVCHVLEYMLLTMAHLTNDLDHEVRRVAIHMANVLYTLLDEHHVNVYCPEKVESPEGPPFVKLIPRPPMNSLLIDLYRSGTEEERHGLKNNLRMMLLIWRDIGEKSPEATNVDAIIKRLQETLSFIETELKDEPPYAYEPEVPDE